MALPAPLVSVVVPTFNRATLVARCIGSLRACGIANLEIIVVDDGGTDDTAAVVRTHDATYLRQENAGPAAARNNGFHTSHGEYVAFIDSDDEWISGEPPRLVQQLTDNPDVDLIFADSQMGSDRDGFVSFVQTYGTDTFFELPHVQRPGNVRLLERRPFFLQLSTRNVMFLGSLLVRREFFAATGGFDPALCGAADWDFFMRATAAGSVAYSDGAAVSRYYKHAMAMSTDSNHMEEDFIKALESVRRRSVLDPIERMHINERIRAHVFGWAWEAYERGDLITTRRRLQLGRRLGPLRPREAAYLAGTYLPRTVVRGLRRAKRFLTSPR